MKKFFDFDSYKLGPITQGMIASILVLGVDRYFQLVSFYLTDSYDTFVLTFLQLLCIIATFVVFKILLVTSNAIEKSTVAKSIRGYSKNGKHNSFLHQLIYLFLICSTVLIIILYFVFSINDYTSKEMLLKISTVLSTLAWFGTLIPSFTKTPRLSFLLFSFEVVAIIIIFNKLWNKLSGFEVLAIILALFSFLTMLLDKLLEYPKE